MKYEKIFLIGNPIAGGGALRRIEKAQEILKKMNIKVETFLTKKKGDAEIFAKQIKENYTDKILVIVAGGDGTYNEVINGLAFSQIPMAILPMGTTSVLAKELKIPNNIKKAVDIAVSGEPQRIHLGIIKNHETQRLFILMAGIGFDGIAVYRVNPKEKRYLKKIAYILSGIKTLFKYSPNELGVHTPEYKKAYNVVICKSSCYGGNFKIAPDAKLIEPCLYTFLSKTKSRIGLVFQILGIIFGFHLKIKHTEYFKTEEIKISGDAHIQIDGDYFGKTPAEIKVIKDALMLVFPYQT